MAVTINGTTGINTPAETVVGASAVGSLQVGGVATNVYPLVSGTAVASTSGTSIDFTSIPSWVKRITVMFNGVSTNGTSNIIIQLGVSGTPETTSYVSTFISVAASSAGTAFTTGLGVSISAAASTYSGQAVISLMNSSTNTWTYSSATTSGSTTLVCGGGAKSLAGTLNMIRITTVNGTDTFDAGSINILYE